MPQGTDEPIKYCTQSENEGSRGNISLQLLLMDIMDRTKKDTCFVNMFAFITKIGEQWRFQENGV